MTNTLSNFQKYADKKLAFTYPKKAELCSLTQTKRSDDLNLPAYIVIVEFSKPICKIAIR
jgi:hypothetical protein